VSDKEA